MTEYYKNKLEQGLEYQDFIAELLMKEIGLSLTNFSSRRYQLRGENMQGVEIKNDDRMKDTGNLYIEIQEKADAKNKRFVNSGIFRNDNTWLYIIGNYEVAYIFSKKFLQLIYKDGKCSYRKVDIPTSKGFLIPVSEAEKYCAKKIIIKDHGGM